VSPDGGNVFWCVEDEGGAVDKAGGVVLREGCGFFLVEVSSGGALGALPFDFDGKELPTADLLFELVVRWCGRRSSIRW
jgi:hypothetical protein